MAKRLVALSLFFATTASFADDAKPVRDARHVDAIRDAVKVYATWGRVDEHPNVAPGMCAMPRPEDYGVAARARRSEADDAPHGKKLYYLYASQKWPYLDAKRTELPIGFAIVKESFAAVPTDEAPAREYKGRDDGRYGAIPPAIATLVDADGKRLKIGKPMGQYVMVKVGKKPGTDDGWIYGTVDPDGTVTSAGRVASCMSCHDEAGKREKLFGLRPAPKP
jgi:hypothetical protein